MRIEQISKIVPGKSLPQHYYFDADSFDTDFKAVISRQWLFVAHESELAKPGDFLTIVVAEESIILVRQDDHSIKAMANVCRHRGSRIVHEACGNAKRFMCQYHAWTYDRSGKLIAARNMPDDFERDDSGLFEFSVSVVEGLVFVRFSQEGPSVEDALGERGLELLGLSGTATAKVVRKKTYECVGNWKLHIENFMECYHCPSSHPEWTALNSNDLNIAFGATYGSQDEKLKDVMDRANKQMDDFAKQCDKLGHPYGFSETTDASKGIWGGTSRKPIDLARGYVTHSRTGQAVAPLMGKHKGFDGGFASVGFGPLAYSILNVDHGTIFSFLPQSANRTDGLLLWFVDGSADEGKDFDTDEVTWMWDTTFKQDSDIVTKNANGISSRYYEPGRYSREEVRTLEFRDWYLEQIKSHAGPSSGE